MPVYAEPGRHGGIALLPGYRTDVTGLTADESRALFVLVTGQAHADLGLGQAIGSALRKVLAALPAPYRDAATLTSQRILVDPVRWRSGPWQSSDLGVVLAQLQDAVFTDRRLQLRYRHSQDQRVRSYTLDPYGLVDKAGVWYLVADHHSQPKLFRADRMVAAAVADQPVRRRAGVELADVWQTLRQRIDDIPAGVRVMVRVRRQTLGRFLLVHRAANLASPPPTKPPPGDPDRIELQLDFRNLDAAQSLLAFGPDVEVISPAPLRDDLARTAGEVVALYTTGQPS